MVDHTNTESWRPNRRAESMDPQVKRMGMAAAGLAGLLVVGFGGYALIGHRPHTIPVVEAESGPVRVRPDNPGGMQIAGADEQIMGGGGGAQTDTMAPPPEVPEPQALRAEIAAAQEAPPPAQTVSLTAPPPAAPPVIASMPETRPTPAPARPPAKAAAATPPTPTHAAAAPVAPSAAPSGGTQVQLAALESAQAAMMEWDRLSKRLPELFRPHHPEVQRTDRDGKTFFRLRTGGFTDIASATAFCAQLHSKGAGCSIASF